MIDSRAAFPQEFAGGSAGKPCARKRLVTISSEFPTVAPASIAPRMQPDHPNREQTAFSGTVNLPWMMGRARSTGCMERSGKIFFNGTYQDDFQMKKGSSLAKVMTLRKETDFDALVKVLTHSLSEERKEDLRAFRQPYNENRHLVSPRINEEKRRKIVLRVLQKYPLVNISHLASCTDSEWSEISRELGGLSHGAVMKRALEYVQTSMSPLDRAVFWAAVGTRQRVVDHGRSCSFAGDVPRDQKKKAAADRKGHLL